MKLVSWMGAGSIAGWGAARLAGADRIRRLEAPAAPLMSFTPHLTAAALLGPLLTELASRRGAEGGSVAPGMAPLLRRKGAAITAALTGAALTAVVLPRAIRRPQPQAVGPVLRVLTANLLAGQAAEETVVRLVRQQKADVLFLQELTDTAVTRLKQAGLNDLLAHEMTDTRGDSARGSGIYARFPLTGGLPFTPVHAAQPTARLELPSGQRADLVCVHAHAPNPPSSRRKVARWREELAILPPPADPPRVLAGDFNATADHAHFRRLLRKGHVDAADETGNGLIPTWGPWGKLALLTIDHVLVDPRCEVLATSVHPLPGSDHRAVYAEFRLPT